MPSSLDEPDGAAARPSFAAEDDPVRVFCTGAKDDWEMLEDLVNHLRCVQTLNLELWSEVDVPPGGARDQEIGRLFDKADLILLMVSVDFIISADWNHPRLQDALERQHKGEVRVIPIIARSCSWRETRLAGLEVLPTDHRPLSESRNRDKELTEIAERICNVIRELRSRPEWTPPWSGVSSTPGPEAWPGAVSSASKAAGSRPAPPGGESDPEMSDVIAQRPVFGDLDAQKAAQRPVFGEQNPQKAARRPSVWEREEPVSGELDALLRD